MVAKRPGVLLVELGANRAVIETKAGRLIISPDHVRFYRAGRGRGRTLLAPANGS
jgi:hypothetical protein